MGVSKEGSEVDIEEGEFKVMVRIELFSPCAQILLLL